MQIDYDLAVEAAEQADLEATAVRSYSGRAMYGATCLGLVCEQEGQLTEFIMALVEIAAERDVHIDTRALTRGLRTDSMGLSMIGYWPGVDLTGSPVEA